MVPNFRPLDRVLTFNWGKLQKGSVVVFKIKGTRYIKRVKELKKDVVILKADNKKVAKGEFKINEGDIIGRVFLKY